MSTARERGWIAEFEAVEGVDAAQSLRSRGYTELEVYTPYEVPHATEALDVERPRFLPRVVLAFGLAGAAVGYLVQWYTNAIDYPLSVGGRPPHSAPSFVPVTFELGILFAALAAFLGLLASARLMRLWQAVFEVPGFGRATCDRSWVAISADDAHFDRDRTREELLAAGARRVEPWGETP